MSRRGPDERGATIRQSLHEALGAIDGGPHEPLEPSVIAERAARGDDPVCKSAADMFSQMLGTVAGNLALSLGALGGVYIGGGVVLAMGAAFDRALFRARFEDKGRMSAYLAPIPTYLITRRWPAFLGLAALLREAA